MPNRIIKETICSSEEIDALTPEQEVFFYRLMVNCDDFGLLDARLKIIASKCYPLKAIDSKKIQTMLNALANVGLIKLYQVEGMPYLAIAKWSEHQQIRAKKPKYPMPEMQNEIDCDASEIICNQAQANVPVIQSNPIQSESNPIQSIGAVRAHVMPDDFFPNETGTAYAKSKGLDLVTELNSFKNHHAAKATKFKDWQAGWRTWCDKAVSFGRANKQAGGSTSAETPYQRSMRERVAEMTGRPTVEPTATGFETAINVTPTRVMIGEPI